jgi:hypothetical protein
MDNVARRSRTPSWCRTWSKGSERLAKRWAQARGVRKDGGIARPALRARPNEARSARARARPSAGGSRGTHSVARGRERAPRRAPAACELRTEPPRDRCGARPTDDVDASNHPIVPLDPADGVLANDRWRGNAGRAGPAAPSTQGQELCRGVKARRGQFRPITVLVTVGRCPRPIPPRRSPSHRLPQEGPPSHRLPQEGPPSHRLLQERPPSHRPALSRPSRRTRPTRTRPRRRGKHPRMRQAQGRSQRPGPGMMPPLSPRATPLDQARREQRPSARRSTRSPARDGRRSRWSSSRSPCAPHPRPRRRHSAAPPARPRTARGSDRCLGRPTSMQPSTRRHRPRWRRRAHSRPRSSRT